MSPIAKRLAALAATTAAAGALALIPGSSYAATSSADALSACPTTSNLCLVTQTSGGQFTIGSMTIPLTSMQLSGSVDPDPDNAQDNLLGQAQLQASALQVPGGLLGVSLIQSLIPGVTDVTATTELAGTPHFSALAALTGTGAALTLPIKIKLGNVLLGSNCTIGSDANPIVLQLTAGTTAPPPPNQPITGNAGTIGVDGSTIVITGATFDDNSFAVPVASGCSPLGLQLLDQTVSGIVNAKQGLPSAAGKNTVVMNADAWLGTSPN